MKESLRNVDWTYLVNRRYSILLTSLFHTGVSDMENVRKHLGVDAILHDCLYLEGIWYYSGKELRRCEQLVADLFSKDRDSCRRISNACYEFGEGLVSWLKLVIHEPEKLKTPLLFDLANQYFRRTSEFLSFLMYPFYLQKHLEEKIIDALKGKAPEEEIFGLLTTLTKPVKENFNTTEQLDILSLTLKIEKKEFTFESPDFKGELKGYLEKYSFIGFRGGLADKWSEDRVFERIEYILGQADVESRLNNLKRDLSTAEEKTKEIMDRYGFDIDARSCVEAAKEIVYLRTYRTDISAMSISLIYPLLEELASRFDLTFDDISHCTPEEILNLESDVPADLGIRKKGFAVIKQDGLRNVYCGNELSELRLMLADDASSSQISGNPANKGFARGIARVLKDKSEIAKVKSGEILVTAMTTPDFIPAMEKAAAFVTDEGGITCHAAIVSRELGKPCIVATRNATKVLKDGDLIEVDANKGTVKKLS